MFKNKVSENPSKVGENPQYIYKKNYIGNKYLLRPVEVNRMRRYSFIIIAMLTLSMLGMMISSVPEEAEASPLTVVTLSLQPDPPNVDVSPGSPGIVTMTGEVTCTKVGADYVKVYLAGSSEFGLASVVPPSFVFSQQSSQEKTESFSATIRVPMGTTYMSTPALTLSGYFDQGGLRQNVPPVSQIMKIEPYYKLEVDTPPPTEIGAGEFVYFSIKITNVGNSEDTYEFIFENLEDLVDKQWTVATITPKTFQEDETKTITVSAQAPQTWTIWRNEVQPFNLRILSQQSFEAGGTVRYDVPLYVRQKGIYIPGFSPMFAFLGIGIVALVMGKRRLNDG
jgi:hypothetical protein